MSNLIKLSSLSRDEKLCFIKSGEGLYTLGRKLVSRPWDEGSVWKVVAGENGEKYIVRVEDQVEEKKSGLPFSEASVMSKVASAKVSQEEPVEYSTDETSGVGNFGTEDSEDYFNTLVVPVLKDFAESYARAKCTNDYKTGYFIHTVGPENGLDEVRLEALGDRIASYIAGYVTGTVTESLKHNEDQADVELIRLQNEADSKGIPLNILVNLKSLTKDIRVRANDTFSVDLSVDTEEPVYIINDVRTGIPVRVPVEISAQDLQELSDGSFSSWCETQVKSIPVTEDIL